MDTFERQADMSVMMDPQIVDTPPSPYAEHVPPQTDVDDLLKRKRKAREHKACYPCRQRKVK